MGVPLSEGGIMSAVRACGGSTPFITFCWMRCMARANCSLVSLPICLVSARALRTNQDTASESSPWGRPGWWVQGPHSPNMCKDVLRQARVHEDVLHFLSTDKAVEVGISLEEDVVIATAIWHGNHPVEWMLGREKCTVRFLSPSRNELVKYSKSQFVSLQQTLVILLSSS